jgi:hypothetical protein
MRRMLAVLSLCGASACAAAPTTPTKAPASDEAKAAKAQSAKAKPAGDEIATVALDDGGLPPGVFSVDSQARSQAGRVPVRPRALDLDALPLVTLPAPLDRDKAPATLPPSKGKSTLKVESIDAGWRSKNGGGNSVYVVLEDKLGRLQIGAVADDKNATERVYRTCGERHYHNPMLTPARWQTLKKSAAGAVEYRIVDAWFDAKSCEASVVRETVVAPVAVLGTLLYAFKTTCNDCVPKETVTFLAPPLSQLAANGVGGEATASQGAFTLIRLPMRRGGASSFAGQVQAHQLTKWNEALGGDNGELREVLMGAEIQHTVADPQPVAIAYATLVRH